MNRAAPRPPRADARRSRERLLAAAKLVFAERGIDAPLDDIARRAEIGNATLYRHFPNRQVLLGAVYRDQIEALQARSAELLAATSPDSALAAWLQAVAETASASRGLADSLLAATRNSGIDMSWCRDAIGGATTALLTRAQHAGAVRHDITAGQVLKLVNAVALATEREPDSAEQVRTLLMVVMDGLRHPTWT